MVSISLQLSVSQKISAHTVSADIAAVLSRAAGSRPRRKHRRCA
jgi:hypothetical protein